MLFALNAAIYFVNTSEQFLEHLDDGELVLTGDVTVTVDQTRDSVTCVISCDGHSLSFQGSVQLANTLSISMSSCTIIHSAKIYIATLVQNSVLFDVHFKLNSPVFHTISASNLIGCSAHSEPSTVTLAVDIRNNVFDRCMADNDKVSATFTGNSVRSTALCQLPNIFTDNMLYDSYSVSAANGFLKLEAGLQIRMQQHTNGNMEQVVRTFTCAGWNETFLVSLMPQCAAGYIRSPDGCTFNGCDGQCACIAYQCVCSDGQDPMLQCKAAETQRSLRGVEIAGWVVFVLLFCGIIAAVLWYFAKPISSCWSRMFQRKSQESKSIHPVSFTDGEHPELILKSATVQDINSQLLLSDQK